MRTVLGRSTGEASTVDTAGAFRRRGRTISELVFTTRSNAASGFLAQFVERDLDRRDPRHAQGQEEIGSGEPGEPRFRRSLSGRAASETRLRRSNGRMGRPSPFSVFSRWPGGFTKVTAIVVGGIATLLIVDIADLGDREGPQLFDRILTPTIDLYLGEIVKQSVDTICRERIGGCSPAMLKEADNAARRILAELESAPR